VLRKELCSAPERQDEALAALHPARAHADQLSRVAG
jgi:hypothetical protein